MSRYIEELFLSMRDEGYDDEYIAICVKYAARLLENNLPVIFDYKHFSMLTGYSVQSIRDYFHNQDYYYMTIQIPKKNGVRYLNVPENGLKKLQKWILNFILNNLSISQGAKGFKKGLSVVENAKPHVNKKCVVSLDIQNFFDSIDSKKVYRIFRYYGYTKQMASLLSNLCLHNNRLPQGAPTSPYLANLVCRKLDKRLMSLSKKIGADYSRYSDDITISANIDLTKYVEECINIIKDEGFKINSEKTRIVFNNERQIVTGVTVNSKLNVPIWIRKKLRQEIYYCKKFGVNKHMQKREINKSHYKQHLFGMAYYIKSINPALGQHFINELNEVYWEY